jgi:tripartite-type tricarboxylate transporter receptor subunit TctC
LKPLSPSWAVAIAREKDEAKIKKKEQRSRRQETEETVVASLVRRICPTGSMVAVMTLGLAAAVALLSVPASAQSWPQRTVKIVTPQPAGTAIDVGLRLVADRLSRRWGQGVVVENRPGGDGIIATASFVQAQDDHALLGSPGYPFTIAPSVLDKLPYDPVSDVTPISLLFETPLMVAANKGLPANSLAELEKLAKAEPGKLNWASTAGLPNFSFNYFVKSNNLAMTYVPYRDVAAPLNDIGEGRIQLFATSYGTVMPHIHSGKIKVLAILGGSRIALAPDVPTVAEAGYPKMKVVGFAGLFGIKGMPATLRDRISADIMSIAQEADVKSMMDKNVQIARGSTVTDFVEALNEQRTQVGEMLRATGQLKTQ